jgi:hypothetical protein
MATNRLKAPCRLISIAHSSGGPQGGSEYRATATSITVVCEVQRTALLETSSHGIIFTSEAYNSKCQYLTPQDVITLFAL